MSRHPPPVLHDAYDLVHSLYRVVPTFPKAQRFVLGQRLEQASLDVLFRVLAANNPAERHVSLERASESIDQLRLLLRLACDLHFVAVDRHETLSAALDKVGRQIGGWRKWADR